MRSWRHPRLLYRATVLDLISMLTRVQIFKVSGRSLPLTPGPSPPKRGEGRKSAERLVQAAVLFEIDVLGPDGAGDVQRGEAGIDVLLLQPAGREAGEGAAEVLAAVDVQVAEEV